jgi:hypothetical protein
MVKIYGSYGGLYVFKIREYVQKKGFLQTPSLQHVASRGGWCKPVRAVSRGISVGDSTSSSRGRILGWALYSGDVVSYVEYMFGALYEDEK